MTTHPPTTHHPTTPSPWQPVGEIVRFELQESLRTRFLPLAFGFFLVVGLLVMHVNGSDVLFFPFLRQAAGTATKPGEMIPYANAPLAIMNTVSLLAGIPLAIVVAGIFADRATKDFTANMDGLLFTSPLKEWQFAAGRLIASFLISLMVFLGLGFGLWLGSILPWMAPQRIGPFNFLSYVQPYLSFVIPNILIFGLFSFALGLLSRRTLTSYLSIVGLYLASSIVIFIFSALNLDPFFNVLANPFGSGSVDYAVRFWTKIEQNTLPVPFAPAIWLSRLIYLGLSAAFFAWIWRRFSFAGMATARPNPRLEQFLDWVERRFLGWKTTPPRELPAEAAPARSELAALPTAHRHYGPDAQASHVWRIAQMELKRLIWNPLVLAVLSISVLVLMVLVGTSIRDNSDLPALPATAFIVEMASLLMKFLAPLLIIFLAGDLIWREREVKVDPFTDPLPVRSWALVLGKLLALALILALVLVLLTVGGLLAQTLQQYTHYELGVYAVGVFTLVLVDLLLISILAMTIQVLVNQKFLGYLLSAALVIVFAQGGNLFRSARLLQYGYKPDAHYSSISGYGGMLEPVRWYQGYWLAIALLLLCISALFWVRGVDTQPKQRWRIARQRFTRPMQTVMGLSALAAILLGGWIFYNTHLLNPALSRAQVEAQVIAYEQAYGRLIEAQPKITAVDWQGDLYPEADGRFAVKGTYTLENKTQKPIDTILLNLPRGIQVNQLTVNGNAATTTAEHPVVQAYEFPLGAPLPPGATAEVSFDLLKKPGSAVAGEGIKDFSSHFENGLNFRSLDFMPMVGFFQRPRLKDAQKRQQAGLPPLDPIVEAARLTQYTPLIPAGDADLAQFSATLSTSADQIAITSGELVRDWVEGNRHYFQYQSREPILPVVPILSGRYEVLKDQWQDVQMELYYHPGHDRNLERMVRGMKNTLDYATQNFGPFPHKTLRLVEVPYVGEAVSYPATITRGERFGYLTKFDDKDPTSVDEAFRIAAHETAHQWWGQQLLPSAAPGNKFLLEALPEYTANQVYGREYGPEKLGFALRRNLDGYLRNRSQSDVPLVEAEAQHLVYLKGALALFALQDYLGEDVVNGALANLLKQYADVPPYPSATDLVAALRAVTPAKYQYLITDLFETVTLYDNRITAATVTPRPDGKFDVTLTINTAKVRSDEAGNETPAPMNQEEIDVGVYNAEGKLIYLKKHPFSDGESQITVTVDQQPLRAGIDPLHKLIDKLPDDNWVAVHEAS
ncbi:hypothetical protein [Thermoleptolyngbya sp. C42_A2020_037]|uniref:ABC transporter permease/M1 family aminopeptidase n=1 Tax=Thermoleptolyngbya sp. C42_A2020_037 TaxID=2747799 RepID=UPI0019FDF890|nr:hypothetical protein [Thermoleptolyngbya sp. C42_A2020_037]MBF2085277.1 hypothetical protein [Thermoleptolyngbya sp. C42_A2020_037]